MNRNELLRRAMRVLAPTADYVQRDDQIEWNDQTQEMPSAEEIEAEVQRQAGFLYQDSRAAEYPPITDYIDGVVKGDQAQIDAYIAACLAVKAKYPKPEQ